MAKITNPKELEALRQKAIAQIDLRTGAKDMRLTVHMGTCGIAAGARDVLMALLDGLAGSDAKVAVTQAGCAGLCDQEPMITLTDKAGKTFRYGRLDKSKVGKIVREHVGRGIPVAECLLQS